MLPIIKTFSAQTADVYKVLADGQELTAREIADRLGILSNAVYRVVQKLINMGMVESLDSYPVRYKALPTQMAMSLYLVAATQNFKREFGLNKQTSALANNDPKISLIKDRPSLLHRENLDARASKQSIDLVVSGHNVPDETMLAYRKATTIGVPIRMIVHQPENANSKETDKWKDMGVSVRYLPDLDIRMFIFDKRVVYMTSYDSKKPASAFGVRFEYVPLALQMSEVFEQNWQKATKL